MERKLCCGCHDDIDENAGLIVDGWLWHDDCLSAVLAESGTACPTCNGIEPENCTDCLYTGTTELPTLESH